MKKHVIFGSVAALALTSCLIFTGCSIKDMTPPKDPAKLNAWIAKNKTSIEQVVRIAATYGAERGLDAWAKKNPDGAKECALALSSNIDDQLLPYFKDGSKLLTASEVQKLLQSSLFNKVPDVVKVAIVTASACLDYYLPIPGSETYLTQDQKDIIAAFLEGLRDGCEEFGPTTRSLKKETKRAAPKATWLAN